MIGHYTTGLHVDSGPCATKGLLFGPRCHEIAVLDLPVTRSTESDDVIERMRVRWIVEVTDAIEMVNVGFAAERLGIVTAELALVSVAFR
ncbi:hypothetical protein GCM10009066_23170 [Halarchaeum salinum]|uniref:Uncharacterized protein n=1 Tax=Halarchaeum salinum TaxID=489912 RepID=A0AAV3SAU3_9EURY